MTADSNNAAHSDAGRKIGHVEGKPSRAFRRKAGVRHFENNDLIISLSLRAKARLRAMTVGDNLSAEELKRGYVKSTRDIIEQAYKAGIGPVVESIVAGYIDTVLIKEVKPRRSAMQTKTKFVESKKKAKAA